MIIIGATITPALTLSELELSSVTGVVVLLINNIVKVAVVKSLMEDVLVAIGVEGAAIELLAELDVLIIVAALEVVVGLAVMKNT